MSRRETPFYEYLISLGAKKNWFEKETNMRSQLYFERKIYDGTTIDEVGIKSQRLLSKIFQSENDYLPMTKIFPNKSKNLYCFNMYAFDEDDFPFCQVLYSNGSFEEIEKNFYLALNEIEKRDINEGKNKEIDHEIRYWTDDDNTYEQYYEDDEDLENGIFEKNKINILNLKYPETFVAGAGNLAIFDIEYKPIYFLNKPLNGNYFLLWGRKNEVKYFLPIKFIIDTDWIDVIVKA
tara:strand:+ start:252 stop:959 length:708 start_codon:yes stop_codon:yes gene_type:complete